MQEMTTLHLKRDCPAIRIPTGEEVELPTGTEVFITQQLGGRYTVRSDYGLYQIDGRHAEALGLQRPAPSAAAPSPSGGQAASEIDEEAVRDTLRTCYDPEIPVNIVDLGLVYELGIEPLPSGERKVWVKMTLTAPGCGMGGAIAGDAQAKLLALPGVGEANVEVVWDPPWSPSMISPEGKKMLGLD